MKDIYIYKKEAICLVPLIFDLSFPIHEKEEPKQTNNLKPTPVNIKICEHIGYQDLHLPISRHPFFCNCLCSNEFLNFNHRHQLGSL